MVEIFAFVIIAISIYCYYAWCCDKRINELIDAAFQERCAHCEFKKSEIPESQKAPNVSEF